VSAKGVERTRASIMRALVYILPTDQLAITYNTLNKAHNSIPPTPNRETKTKPNTEMGATSLKEEGRSPVMLYYTFLVASRFRVQIQTRCASSV
jgi:hypothetical protein